VTEDTQAIFTADRQTEQRTWNTLPRLRCPGMCSRLQHCCIRISRCISSRLGSASLPPPTWASHSACTH